MTRISVQGHFTDGAHWLGLAREVERLGFDGLYAADHPGTSAAPFVALAAAATATEHIRLGTCVLNAGRWDPVVLASELATLDLISGGRSVFGIGAGHTPSEWSMVGLEHPSAGRRVDRLIELVRAVRPLLAGETVTEIGTLITLHEARLSEPRPIQAPIPLMVGGNGRLLLRFAAECADIVGVSGLSKTLPDGHSHEVEWATAALDRTFDLIASAAARAGRHPDIEALVQHIEITDDPEQAATGLADSIPGVSVHEILGSPFMWIGTPAHIVTRIAEFERRWGINRYVVRDPVLEAAGTVVKLLGA